MAFTDGLIRAAVHTGAYTDPAAEAHLAAVLIERRDAIGRAYLVAINPPVNPRLAADGRQTFDNAAVAAGFAAAPRSYHTRLVAFRQRDRRHDADRRERRRHRIDPPPAALPSEPGAYVEIDISAADDTNLSWRQPVRTHFRRTADGWRLVGLDRLSAAPAAARSAPVATRDR